uniref:Uncharacterized protein n=1 Tax=Leptobrachium leishanense TaxID=445787 RepID=A0A8C5PDR2_9ANUR
MPGLQDKRPPKEEDSVCEILNRFIGVPEQTYEQFAGGFSRRPSARTESGCHRKPSQGPYRGSLKVDLSDELNSMVESAGANAAMVDRSEDQILLDDGIQVGSDYNIDLSHPHKIQIDNYVDPADSEDADSDGVEELYRNLELLPGEAEITCYLPTFSRDTHLEFQVAPQSRQVPTIHQTDDVQPFVLEEGFDYDCVALSPKFSADELKLLKTLRRNNINLQPTSSRESSKNTHK